MLVSSTVHDAETGSGFTFDDRGLHTLKGGGRVAALPRSCDPGVAREAIGAPVLRPFSHARRSRGSGGVLLLFVLSGLYSRCAADPTTRPRSDDADLHRRRASPRPYTPQLSYVGDVMEAALSPDGKTFAYITGRYYGVQKIMVKTSLGDRPSRFWRVEPSAASAGRRMI